MHCPLGKCRNTPASLTSTASSPSKRRILSAQPSTSWIVPAMLLTATIYQRLGLRRLRTQALPIGRPWQVVLFGLGVIMVAVPFVVQRPIGTLTLWLGVLFLLDPLNHWLAGRSRWAPADGSNAGAATNQTLIADWQAGRWGRTLALMAAGATCGFLWEFWNYWAAAKWTYDLPFLGPLEHVRYNGPLGGGIVSASANGRRAKSIAPKLTDKRKDSRSRRKASRWMRPSITTTPLKPARPSETSAMIASASAPAKVIAPLPN